MEDTKVIIKRDQDTPWEPDSMFYMLTANGLFTCRNHEWFTSSALAKSGPDELAEHKPFIQLRYPKLSQAKFEQVVGLFDWAEIKHGEAAVLLIHNKETGQVDVLVPEQECSWGSVNYTVPVLPDGWRLMGDIHSHVRMPAYSSYTDKDDEEHRPGLHLVVGKIDLEPPDFHAEVVADGQRFKIDSIKQVVEGYAKRADFPKEWKQKLKIKKWTSTWTGGGSGDKWWKSDGYYEKGGRWGSDWKYKHKHGGGSV